MWIAYIVDNRLRAPHKEHASKYTKFTTLSLIKLLNNMCKVTSLCSFPFPIKITKWDTVFIILSWIDVLITVDMQPYIHSVLKLLLDISIFKLLKQLIWCILCYVFSISPTLCSYCGNEIVVFNSSWVFIVFNDLVCSQKIPLISNFCVKLFGSKTESGLYLYFVVRLSSSSWYSACNRKYNVN